MRRAQRGDGGKHKDVLHHVHGHAGVSRACVPYRGAGLLKIYQEDARGVFEASCIGAHNISTLGLEPHSEGELGAANCNCVCGSFTQKSGETPQYHMGQHQEILSPGTPSLYFLHKVLSGVPSSRLPPGALWGERRQAAPRPP